MQGRTIRRIAAVGAGLALALGCAGTAQARLTPPGTAAAKTCTTQAAGYGPLAGRPDTESWVFYGDLNVRLCISRGTGGWFWASARLDSPANYSKFDRFTGGWTIRLQGCASRSATTLTSTVENWDNADHPLYDVAALSGSRYLFSEIYTPNHADSYGSYRVWAHSTAAAVVPRNAIWSYSLSPNGIYTGTEDFYGPCTRA